MNTYNKQHLTTDGENYYWKGVKIELNNEAAYTEDGVSSDTWREVQLAKDKYGHWVPSETETDGEVLVTLYIPILNSAELPDEIKELVIKEKISKEFYFNYDGQDLDYFDFENLNNISVRN